MKENIILVDFDKNEDFDLDQQLSEYSSQKWTVKNFANNYYPRLVRQLTYFVFPLLYLFRLKRYNKILAWQQFFGIILAFYCRLLHVKKKRFITIMTFIYKPKKGIVGRFYYRFVRYAVESKYVEQVICYSRNEVDHYSRLFKQKFVFCPLGIRDCFDDYTKEHKKPTPKEGGYFLSCGRSNRDYDFLLDAFKNSPYKLKIICDELNVESTDHIEIYNDVRDQGYYEMLSKCYAVIIPLKDKIISSGQMVLLESMMFGKPIIVTTTKGLKDYINPDITMIDNTAEDLSLAIDHIMDDESYAQLSDSLREHYLHSFTREIMFQTICRIIYS